MAARAQTDAFEKATEAEHLKSRAMRRRQSLLILSLVLGALLNPCVVQAATLTRTAAFAYDAASGLLAKEVIEPDSSALCLVTEYAYDAYGNKTSGATRNCNGSAGEAAAPSGDAVIVARTDKQTYDARGQFPVSSANALNQSESKTYDAKFGVLTKLTGPNGLSTTWQYDGFGRKTLETRADGTRTRWDYLYCSGIQGGTAACPTMGGAAGKWLIQETPLAADGVTQNGPIGKRYFDALDREIRIETQGFDGNGTATAIYKDTQYDNLGRPYKVSRPYYAGQTAYWTTVTYDALGRVIQETQPDGSTVSTAYNGLTTTITDPLGRKTSTAVNSQGQIVKVIDAQNSALTYSHDPFGNLLKTTDPLGNVVTLTYDLRGRKTGMRDPDMGNWTYVYNALGELVKQTDAKSQVSTMLYDRLGRLTRRSEPDLISNWYYDAYKSGAACQKGIGKLCQAETSTGYNRTLSYDTLGRQTSSATTIDVPTPYTATVSYDPQGRIATQSYPSGLTIKHLYTALGYLKEIRNHANNALYWRADTLDAEGHLRQQTYGNTIVTQQTWNTLGRLTGIVAGAGNGVQNLGYQYDKAGNLTTRTDGNQNLTENFIYDSLNRLTSATVNASGAGIVTTSYAYDALGNITHKSDLGAYVYPASGASSIRPHAVSQINLSAAAGGGKISFTYDANGALTTQTQTNASNQTVAAKSRSQYYTSFNMPQSMSQGSISAAFYYGPEHQRVKQISSVQGATIYVNPGNEGALFYEKDIKPNGSIEQRAFINAGGQAIAIVKTTTAGNATTTSTRYLHRDHLGSITAITDESGAVLERLAYEPFGKRRFANGANDPNHTILPVNTDRGFTGHEMLDEIGLVHMNGRIYDPVVGRFLSADPLIQSPYNLQSHNRYSYVMNNPLGYIDPSGYSWLSKTWKKIWKSPVGRIAITVAVAWVTGYYDGGIFANAGWGATTTAIANTAAAGFASGYVGSGWDFRAGLQGSFTALLFYGAGSFAGYQGWGEGSFGRAAAHAVAGCVGAAAGGGRCGNGALAAGFAEGIGGHLQFKSVEANLVARTVIGGTASVLGGGKFANGAVTAAFGYLFNRCAHNGCWTTQEERAYLDRGDFRGYYTEACRGGDLNACRFYGIATGEEPGPSAVLRKALLASGYSFAETSKLVQSTIPLNLANDYANLLPQREAAAAFPSAGAIRDYHWAEFDKYGLPPSTFGGTPFGKSFDVVPRGLWCTLCTP